MLTCRRKLLLVGCLAVLWLAPGLVWACSVPVFRYALERWPADAYQLFVFHSEPLATNQKALLDAWKEAGEKGMVNLAVEKVTVSDNMTGPQQKLWRTQTNAALPWVVVLYPPEKEMELPVWAGALGSDMLISLFDSPARREVVRRLCKGDSAVWLLLESGDKKRDEEVAKLFETQSRKLEKSLRLPEAEPDGPQVRSEVPLKIAFSTIRFSRKDPAEQMFRDMLLHLDEGLARVTEPLVFAVFGRGRALPMPTGKDLRVEVIDEVAEFLTSACSCEVKNLNPGIDLLLAADWDGLLEGRLVKDPELPPLVGMAQFASAALATNREANSLVISNAATGYDGGGSFARNLGFVLMFGLVAVGIGTILLKIKARRP